MANLHVVCEHSFLLTNRMSHPKIIHCAVTFITSSLHNVFVFHLNVDVDQHDTVLVLHAHSFAIFSLLFNLHKLIYLFFFTPEAVDLKPNIFLRGLQFNLFISS